MDLSAGLPDAREDIARVEPSIPFWADNLLFAVHDPSTGVAMWLHLNSVPNDWSMWHENCFALMPGEDGVVSSWSFHRTAPDRRPAGASMSFECLQPFRRWRVTFDGHGMHASLADVRRSLAPHGVTVRWKFDLEIECVTPAWDYRTSVHSQSGRGSMDNQSFASEHYEQMYWAHGTVQFGRDELPFDGYGWRDHSQGPRGSGEGTVWGGHVTAGTVYESGRGWGATQFWGPDGSVNLEAAWVSERPGELQHARVVDAPQLTRLVTDGEELPFVLEWTGGRLETSIRTTRSLWLAIVSASGLTPRGIVLGRNPHREGTMYLPEWGTSEWNGELGRSFVERSNPLNALPKARA